jgi:hypothetical protein
MPTISFNATTGPRALAVTPSEAVLAVELLEGYEVWLGRVAQEHRV